MDQVTPGDAAALIRAYLAGDAEAFEVLLPGDHDELLLTAFGVACTLAERAAGGRVEFDVALQRYIEHFRGYHDQ
jgi:hypothetical protein